MASLVPTKKFLVWAPPIGQVVYQKEVEILTKSLSEVVIARGLSEVVVVGGGRKVLVSDVAKVAVLKYAISLNEATIEKIDADLISCTDIIESNIIGAKSVPNNSELIYPSALCRAAVFARVVSLMQCKSGVRSNVIKCLVSMLDADVVPNFSSPELAGLELCLVITGTGASCHVNGIAMSSTAAFSVVGLTHVDLTAQEALTIKLGQFWSTGCACLIAAGAANMVNMMDSVAALSCDSFGANIEPFDAAHFDSCRQHRGQISSASNLRLLLQGSNRVNSPASNTSTAALAFSCIPQVNGPAQDYISTTVKLVSIIFSLPCLSMNYLHESIWLIKKQLLCNDLSTIL
jgi:histidine ammonia-lyase